MRVPLPAFLPTLGVLSFFTLNYSPHNRCEVFNVFFYRIFINLIIFMTMSLIVGFLITINIFTYFSLLDYFLKQILAWEYTAGIMTFWYIVELPSKVILSFLIVSSNEWKRVAITHVFDSIRFSNLKNCLMSIKMELHIFVIDSMVRFFFHISSWFDFSLIRCNVDVPFLFSNFSL